MRLLCLALAVPTLLSCSTPSGTPRRCPGPGDDCECSSEDLEIPCYLSPEHRDGKLICRIGTRTCEDGRWGGCDDIEITEHDLAGALVEGPNECNDCNPDCQINRDRPNDADLNAMNSEDVSYDPVTGGIRPTGDASMTMMVHEGSGPAEGMPFDLVMGEADSLAVDPMDGALVLRSNAVNTDYIWIANTPQGTVSKYDIRTYREVGRYFVGPLGTGNDPSRTSINTSGDAFVGGRWGTFVTRISVLGEDCPDTNGDGVVTTSRDIDGNGSISTTIANGELLAWGQDDCILWTRDMLPHFPGRYLRAVAAQDLIDPMTGNVNEFVWAGGYNDRRIALIDGRTGAVLRTAEVTGQPYGFALDRRQNLWISTLYNNQLIRVDTNRCNAAGCPWAGHCYGEAACDAEIKQTITTPVNPYGITVDLNQRIWLGGTDVMRYDPSAAPGSRMVRSFYTAGGWKAGIAGDSLGNIWTTGSFGVLRIDMNNPTSYQVIPYDAPSGWARGWGVAVDAEDKTWVIGRWDNRAFVFTPAGGPATGLNNWTERTEATNINAPYTYSDMTGSQLRLASANRGTYLQTFEACAGGFAEWEQVTFDADTPMGTFIAFRVRVADTQAGLAAAPWVGIGAAPPGASPLAVRAALLAAGQNVNAQFAQLELSLVSNASTPTMFVTPRVRGFALEHNCIVPDTGFYRRVYDATEACTVPPDRPVWGAFEWFSTTPGMSSIEFIIKTAPDAARLATAPTTRVAVPPNPDNGMVDIGTVLMAAGMPTNEPLLEITATLVPIGLSLPTLVGMDLTYDCVPME